MAGTRPEGHVCRQAKGGRQSWTFADQEHNDGWLLLRHQQPHRELPVCESFQSLDFSDDTVAVEYGGLRYDCDCGFSLAFILFLRLYSSRFIEWR